MSDLSVQHRVYLTGPSIRPADLASIEADLIAIGVGMRCTLFDVPAGFPLTVLAPSTLDAIRLCNIFLWIADRGHPENSRPTCGVEFGLAYASGIECWVIGQRDLYLHHLPGVLQFNTWEETMALLSARTSGDHIRMGVTRKAS